MVITNVKQMDDQERSEVWAERVHSLLSCTNLEGRSRDRDQVDGDLFSVILVTEL